MTVNGGFSCFFPFLPVSSRFLPFLPISRCFPVVTRFFSFFFFFFSPVSSRFFPFLPVYSCFFLFIPVFSLSSYFFLFFNVSYRFFPFLHISSHFFWDLFSFFSLLKKIGTRYIYTLRDFCSVIWQDNGQPPCLSTFEDPHPLSPFCG